MTIKVECTVEPTKNNSPKWRWLVPPTGSPIGNIPVKASEVDGKKKLTVTLS